MSQRCCGNIWISMLSEDTTAKLNVYAKLVYKWNQSYNLTAAKSVEAIFQEHILDSLRIVSYIKGPNILDVGSGAGFPGIPLAIVLPQYQFTLLDSQIKRTRFLEQVKMELKMQNVVVVHQRIEAFHPLHSFDTIVTRATYALNDFADKTKHLLAQDGEILAMKGKYPTEELQQVSKQYQVVTHKLEPLDFNNERHLVSIKVKIND